MNHIINAFKNLPRRGQHNFVKILCLALGLAIRVGTFGTESAVRKRGGSRNLPYLNAKPRQIPLLDTYA